jgi:hypothetical protein
MATLFLFSCKPSGGDPKTVAKNFFEALKTMNVDEASKYATRDSKSMLDPNENGNEHGSQKPGFT